MGVFLVSAILFVITLAFAILMEIAIKNYCCDITGTFMERLCYVFNDIVCEILIWLLTIVLFINLLILSIYGGVTYARQDINYQQAYQQYIVLTERIEKDNSEYHLFYEDITEYNNAILEDRHWADNKWVNWYHNGKIRYLPLIGEEKEEKC